MIKVQQWGNSQGIRLPKDVLETVGLKIGDQLQWIIQKGQIILQPLSLTRGYTLAKLLHDVPKDWDQNEIDWGAPAGKEAW